MDRTEQLIRDSQTGDVGNRKKAIRQLAYQPESAAFDTLIEVLFDPDAGIRLAALEALEARGDKRAVSYILKLAQDPDLCCLDDNPDYPPGVYICPALASFGSDAVDELLANRYLPIVGVLGALGKIGDKRALKPLQEIVSGTDLQDTSDDDWKSIHRSEAMEALGDLGDKSSFDLLNRIALDEYDPKRILAISALRRLKDDRAVPTLTKIFNELSKYTDIYSDGGVLLALMDLGPAGHQAIYSFAKDIELPKRNLAIVALRTMNTPEAMDLLAEIATNVNEPDSGWKCAIHALGLQWPIDRLKQIIPDLPPERRQEAIDRIRGWDDYLRRKNGTGSNEPE